MSSIQTDSTLYSRVYVGVTDEFPLSSFLDSFECFMAGIKYLCHRAS